MLSWLFDYSLFLAKGTTGVLLVLFLVMGIIFLVLRTKENDRAGTFSVTDWRKELDGYEALLKREIETQADFKKWTKARKKGSKQKVKAEKTIFLLDFHGDIQASQVEALQKVVTAILLQAVPGDEVILRLESGGGMVHTYGLAASQLMRIRAAGVKLIVCVDKIAASGGYLMASVAHEIWAAPFAIIGSIGVIAQLPNFHRFLEKHHIDFELHTAGTYKRKLTLFGENTQDGREKLKEELEEIHALFQSFIYTYRPNIELSKVSTGEHWFGEKAMTLGLVDKIGTSEDLLLDLYRNKKAAIHQIGYEEQHSMLERVSKKLMHSVSAIFSSYSHHSASK